MAYETIETVTIGSNEIVHQRDDTIGAHRVVVDAAEGDGYPVMLIARGAARAAACSEEFIAAVPAGLTAPATIFKIEV